MEEAREFLRHDEYYNIFQIEELLSKHSHSLPEKKELVLGEANRAIACGDKVYAADIEEIEGKK